MKRRHSPVASLAAIAGALSVLLGITAVPVFAATSGANTVTGAGNGIKISPVRSDLTVNPGQGATLDVYITNVTSQTASFQVVANDFVASGDESGNPAIILNTNQSAPHHGLKNYVKPISNITLKPQEQKDVKVVIAIPANAVAGGYYGAIRVLPASATDTSGKNISLAASVASLVLVKVPGNISEQMSVAGFDARVKDKPRTFFTSNKGITGVIRFQNEGDIQEQPFGKVVVKNMRGKVVGSGYEVNNSDPRGNVLPDSVRKFSIPLKNIGSFGRYTMEGNFGYGSNGQLLSAKSTFYVVPVPFMVIGVVLIIIVLVAIFELPRMIRRYNRRILRRAGR